MVTLLLARALAADPVITEQADGSIVATATIAASPDVVRAALADPVACGALSPDILSVTATPAGKCTMLDVVSRGAWNPLRWRALRCPTADGWRDDLVSSTDIQSMHSEWRVLAAADGTTTVEYRTNTQVSLAGVPDSLIHQGMMRSAKDTVVRLIARVVPDRLP